MVLAASHRFLWNKFSECVVFRHTAVADSLQTYGLRATIKTPATNFGSMKKPFSKIITLLNLP
jgi:hypothetical protein